MLTKDKINPNCFLILSNINTIFTMLLTVTLFCVAVQAVARCCTRSSLECTYMKAGPSGESREDRIEIMCPDETVAVGTYLFPM